MSCILAIAGLAALSAAGTAMIFLAATLYALGKIFGPTMLGIVSEQTQGGALTLNAASGIECRCYVLGFPLIGALQANKEISEVSKTNAPGLVENGEIVGDATEEKSIYQIINYSTLNAGL